ncbi:MAG: prenyltransferase/squalene oxidase repeat-containing protein [bacterium]
MKTDQDVLDYLKRLPRVEVSHDLAPEILTKVREAQNNKSLQPGLWRILIPLAAAATVALLFGGLWMGGARTLDPRRQAATWLCQSQEPDGSWSAAKWGGSKQFEVALTGLSLMTLLDGTSRNNPAIEKAVAYLIEHQQPDGQFGEQFAGTPYNQGIATLALAKAYESRKGEVLQVALDKAISVICFSQYNDGGWGYHNEAHPASNLSITLWQIEALRLASQQGWSGVRPRVERGLRWMAGVAADDGSFGYQKSGDTPGGASQTLTAMGAMSLLDPAHIGLVSPSRRQAIKAQMQRLASTSGPDMDYYRRYFLTAALKKMKEESAQQGLVAIRRELVTRQIKQGAEAGSWQADTRWGSSGGRIYATAMASLSLR